MGRSCCDGIEYGVLLFLNLYPSFYSLDPSLYWILDRMTHDTFLFSFAFWLIILLFLSLSCMLIFGLKR